MSFTRDLLAWIDADYNSRNAAVNRSMAELPACTRDENIIIMVCGLRIEVWRSPIMYPSLSFAR